MKPACFFPHSLLPSLSHFFLPSLPPFILVFSYLRSLALYFFVCSSFPITVFFLSCPLYFRKMDPCTVYPHFIHYHLCLVTLYESMSSLFICFPSKVCKNPSSKPIIYILDTRTPIITPVDVSKCLLIVYLSVYLCMSPTS